MLRALALAALLTLSTLAAAPSLAATSKSSSAKKANASKASKASKAKTKAPVKRKSTRKSTVRKTPAAPLRSPISPGALDRDNSRSNGPELKARSVPDRAYAVDGNTFFHQGKKYRIAGLESSPGDLARQRLQMALDKGKLRIEQLETDEMGVTSAHVYAGDRNLSINVEP